MLKSRLAGFERRQCVTQQALHQRMNSALELVWATLEYRRDQASTGVIVDDQDLIC